MSAPVFIESLYVDAAAAAPRPASSAAATAPVFVASLYVGADVSSPPPPSEKVLSLYQTVDASVPPACAPSHPAAAPLLVSSMYEGVSDAVPSGHPNAPVAISFYAAVPASLPPGVPEASAWKPHASSDGAAPLGYETTSPVAADAYLPASSLAKPAAADPAAPPASTAGEIAAARTQLAAARDGSAALAARVRATRWAADDHVLSTAAGTLPNLIPLAEAAVRVERCDAFVAAAASVAAAAKVFDEWRLDSSDYEQGLPAVANATFLAALRVVYARLSCLLKHASRYDVAAVHRAQQEVEFGAIPAAFFEDVWMRLCPCSSQFSVSTVYLLEELRRMFPANVAPLSSHDLRLVGLALSRPFCVGAEEIVTLPAFLQMRRLAADIGSAPAALLRLVRLPGFAGFLTSGEVAAALAVYPPTNYVIRFSAHRLHSLVVQSGKSKYRLQASRVAPGMFERDATGAPCSLEAALDVLKRANAAPVEVPIFLRSSLFSGWLARDVPELLLRGAAAGTYFFRGSSDATMLAVTYVRADGTVASLQVRREPPGDTGGLRVVGGGPPYATPDALAETLANSGKLRQPFRFGHGDFLHGVSSRHSSGSPACPS
jgi:hypothetical protein